MISIDENADSGRAAAQAAWKERIGHRDEPLGMGPAQAFSTYLASPTTWPSAALGSAEGSVLTNPRAGCRRHAAGRLTARQGLVHQASRQGGRTVSGLSIADRREARLKPVLEYFGACCGQHIIGRHMPLRPKSRPVFDYPTNLNPTAAKW